MKVKKAISISIISVIFAFAEKAHSQTWRLSIEQDLLPYLTGGYYGAFWVGKGHMRGRALVAHVNKPSFIVPNGFTNNQVTAFALLADFFPKEKWTGWHMGAGIVLWQSSIQSNQRLQTAKYENVLLNGSIGYNWKLGTHFYVCPWAGMHLKVGGTSTVSVDNVSFETPLLTPEASVKLGWVF